MTIRSFTRVPDNWDIIFVEGDKGRSVTDTYRGARERFVKYPDLDYRFYIDMGEGVLEVYPVVEFYSGMCIEFVVEKGRI